MVNAPEGLTKLFWREDLIEKRNFATIFSKFSEEWASSFTIYIYIYVCVCVCIYYTIYIYINVGYYDIIGISCPCVCINLVLLATCLQI